jgi:Flp pilus assembly protein TadG
MRRQRGQSLVEFAVGSAALLMLLLGVVTLSGYQEVQRRASVAARQFAYESAWEPSLLSAQVSAQRIHRDNFDDSGLLDSVGRARYVTREGVRVERQQGVAPGLAGDAATLLLTPLAASKPFTGADLDLEAGGYVSGELVARVVTHAWTPEPFRSMDITLHQPYAILSDPWNSGSSSQVHDRTSSLVPTQRLATIANAWQALAVPLSIIEPTIGKLCLGLIEPDTIPEDRLGPRKGAMSLGRVCQ